MSHMVKLLALALGVSFAHAEIHTFNNFTRPANAAALTETFDFVPNEGWSGTPPNAISGQESVYLKVTVSWTPVTNIGTFQARFNAIDNGEAGRFAIGKSSAGTSGFEFITANATSDRDGSGPATARPAITAINTNTTTSVTLVLKVNQLQAAIRPPDYPDQPVIDYDRWYGNIAQQSQAAGFMWINPNLSATEASQSTVWAAWRSGNTSYAGVSFITDTADADLHFSNIALYTGDDTPFATTAAIADAVTSTASASPTSVPADGSTTSTITVTLKDAGNVPVAGKQVSLTGNSAAIIQTSNNISNASGVVTFTVKSETPGTEIFTATDVTDANLIITQTASVNFQEIVPVGPVNAANSTVTASPSSILANGISTSTVTVTLRDGNGALIVGEGVSLAGNPVGATITPASAQITNAFGQAVFTVKSTTIGPVVFTATSVTATTTITQTAGVTFTDPLLAQAFNVNFHAGTPTTGLVGLIGSSGETWNQGTTSVSNLIDTTGLINSTVAVTGLPSSGNSDAAATASLNVFDVNRNFFGKGQDTTVQITGLTPNTAYDIYIYALSHNVASWGKIADTERAAGDFVTSNTVLGNGQTQWLDNGKAGTNGNSFVPNGNYVVFQSIVTNGSGNISIVVDAHDGLDGLANTNDDGNCRLHVCGLQIRPASGMSVDYMNWRTAYYPGAGLPNADDDGDGLSNNVEHIFGLNPTTGSSTSPYLQTLDPGTGFFRYTRRSATLINMEYKVWVSTNLENWSVDNAANQIVESTVNGVQTVGVELDPTLLGEEKLFVQIRATPITGLDPEPTLINLWGSGNTITVLFSEPMNPSSAANLDNYSVALTGGGTIPILSATLNPGGGSVTLTLASALGINTGYTVDLSRVTSTTGQSLGSITRQFRTWDDNPNGIKVFILAGQSNMVGYGNVETGATGAGTIGSLRYLAANDASYPEYTYASLLTNPADTSSAFRTRSDVKVWWRNGPNGNFNLGGAISKGDLGPPYKGADSGKIGPEFAFGQIVGDFYPDHDVLIIKCSWGGRDLAEKFRSPTAVANRGGQVGEFFNGSIELTREVLENLGTQFPEWAGRGYQIVGFAWHQGYNDRINTAFSNTYKYNLPDFITSMRQVFNKPNMPFVIASTGMDTGAPAAPPYTSYSKVERAQLWVDTTAEPGLPTPPLQPASVLSTDTRPFWRLASQSPATSGQGYHWNHNAESYFLIGKALGDNMINLLGEP